MLEGSPNAGLKAWAEEQRAKVSQVVDNSQQQPVEEQTVVPESTDLPDKQVAQEEVKEPKKEEAAPEKEQPTLSWDADETEVKTVESPKFDFSELSSALELGEIKDAKDFVAKVSEIKKQNKALSEKPLEGIPEEFREVIEVAKTGDWKEYLSNQLIDYTKLDPFQEFENDFYKRYGARFVVDGKFNQEAYDAALDAIPEVQQELAGQQILEAKAQLQARARESQRQKAEAKRELADKNLSKAANNLQEILPLDSFGIKFENKHSTKIYQGISNSELTKKHLGMSYDDLVRTGADMTLVAKSIAMAEWGQQMIKFKADNIKAQTKKEILTKTQNVQL